MPCTISRTRCKANKDEFESRDVTAEQLLHELKPLLATEEERRVGSEMEAQLPMFKGYFEQVATASMAGKHTDALKEYTDYSSKALDTLEKGAEQLRGSQARLIDQSQNTASNDASKGRWMAVILALAALLVAPFVFVAIQRITRQLRHAAVDLGDGSEQIASAAAQVASSSGSLAQGASEQAACLEETSASAEEITSMTRKNAENSRVAAEMMAAVDRHIQDGNRTLGEMVVRCRRSIPPATKSRKSSR